MCGVFGVYGIENVVNELYTGGIALQHRGQDACGMHTYDGRFNVKKGRGLVQQVFKHEHVARLKGDSGIVHVRYATVGGGSNEDIQPFYESSFFKTSMAHNGNLTNFTELRKAFGNFASNCDLEAMLKVFHHSAVTSWMKDMIAERMPEDSQMTPSEDVRSVTIPDRMTMSDVSIDSVFSAVREVMSRCKGSFSAVANIPDLGMMGFRDPYGIKPLCFGKKTHSSGTAFAFSSEDIAFQLPLDYDFVKDVPAGGAILVTKDGRVIEHQIDASRAASPCVFEWIYFASQCSSFYGISVSEFRYQLGKELGRSWLSEDLPFGKGVVCAAIPSASERGAVGFSDATGIPERDVFVRNNYMKRGFILPDRKSREYNAMLKLPIDFSVLNDVHTAVLVDDSIVRGDTSKELISRLRMETQKRGLPLKTVYFLSLAPPNYFPCVYGIDMSVDKEMIASNSEGVEGVRKYIGADYLIYNRIESLRSVMNKLSGPDIGFCNACFSGKYPTGITQHDIERLKEERLHDKASDY
jgi:amidophosphoribosyltransferase